MTDHTRTEKIGGDSINFYGHPSRAGNRYDSLATPLGNKRVRPILSHMLSFMLLRMLNLSIVFICIVIMHIFLFIYGILVLCFNNMVSFLVQIMNGVGKGSFIPPYTLTCIFIT